MRVAIDKAGRVVVPKSVRDALRLTAGAELELTVVDGRIELDPGGEHATLSYDEVGRPVVEAPGAADITIDDVRSLRLSLQDPLDRGHG